MAKAKIRAAGIMAQREAEFLKGWCFVPGSADPTALDIPAGSPVVEYTGGKVDEATLSTYFVTSANKIIGITTERFLGTRYNTVVNGAFNSKIQADLVTPLTPIEANLYYDGAEGANEILSQAEVFSTCVMKKVAALGVYVFDNVTTPSSMATFKVLKLVDAIGTTHGRIVAVPEAPYCQFGFALII